MRDGLINKDNAMADMAFSQNYRSEDHTPPAFPSLIFYGKMINIIWNAGKVASKGVYDGDRWVDDSILVARAIERVGAKLCIEGIENLDFEGPCVFESNHMSTLETMLLPGVIQPRKDVTFVVKDTLLRYPGLGPVLKARSPIALGRTNVREDLTLVLRRGPEILASGRSLIIFTQGTRRPVVKAEDFNTLAVKLAAKAGVPVVPIALKTDAWGIGGIIKEAGRIRPRFPVHVRIGAPVDVSGNAREAHAQIVRFITENCDAWTKTDGRP